MILLSFVFFLVAFVVIGILSSSQKRKTSQDYLLAGQSMKPWLVALSAVATNNSGYMFIGMIGYTYMVGLASIWLMVGWIVGDFCASLLIHRKVRRVSESSKVLTFVGVLSSWHNTDYKRLRFVGGVLTVIFLGTYAAAQFNAGGKALYVLLGWEQAYSTITCAVLVMLYSFAGGLRASIWTNTAQSFVMFGAMALMCVTAIMASGGISSFIGQLDSVSGTYLDWFPEGISGGFAGPIMFVVGYLFAGFGIVGQPHIMTLFMTMDRAEDMPRVRAHYYTWFTLFYAMTIILGLAARLLLPGAGTFDAELAMPMLAQSLLPSLLIGVVLAGLFAAAMSTADSQLICCSAALTRDITGGKALPYHVTRFTTLGVTFVALAIALFGSSSVFTLVLVAWSALGASFAPLLVVYAFGGRPSENLALTMMGAGLGVALLWRYAGLHTQIYELMPGMLAGFSPYIIMRLVALLSSPAEVNYTHNKTRKEAPLGVRAKKS